MASGRTILRFVRFEGLRVEEVRYAPGYVLAPHAHASASIALVLEGGLTEGAEGRVDVASAGSVVRKPPGLTHENRFGARGARILSVSIEPNAATRRSLPGARFPAWEWVPFGSAARALLRLGSMLGTVPCDAASAPRRAIAIRREVRSLFASGHGSSDAGSSWLDGVRAEIERRFDEPLRVRDLAERARVHPVSLARAFRKAFGCSVTEAIRATRLRAAAARIAEGGASLAAVAVSTGFADQAHLTRRFREATGQTPSSFRRFVDAGSAGRMR